VNTKQKLPLAAQITIIVVAIVLVALVGWFALVHPKNAKAASLSKQLDTAQAELVQAQAAVAAAKHEQPVRVANLFRLAKAMPDGQDMSGILLQLNQVAEETGITFESIKPDPEVSLGGYAVVPIELNFSGSFYDLSDLLLRLRTLVIVRDGELDAMGRLFAIDSLSFGPAPGGFPQIEATLTVDAFVYGSGTTVAGAAPAPLTPATTTTDTTAASPTDSTVAAAGVTH
jgi:hypothetical protein